MYTQDWPSTNGVTLQCDRGVIEAAVRLLTKDTQRREMRCLERRCNTRLPFQRPVQITPLVDDRETVDPTIDAPISAYTRNITMDGVGILHDQPIDSKQVLLTFELLGGSEVSLAASLTWCRYLGDFWYASGGRLLGVVPTERQAIWTEELADIISCEVTT